MLRRLNRYHPEILNNCLDPRHSLDWDLLQTPLTTDSNRQLEVDSQSKEMCSFWLWIISFIHFVWNWWHCIHWKLVANSIASFAATIGTNWIQLWTIAGKERITASSSYSALARSTGGSGRRPQPEIYTAKQRSIERRPQIGYAIRIDSRPQAECGPLPGARLRHRRHWTLFPAAGGGLPAWFARRHHPREDGRWRVGHGSGAQSLHR